MIRLASKGVNRENMWLIDVSSHASRLYPLQIGRCILIWYDLNMSEIRTSVLFLWGISFFSTLCLLFQASPSFQALRFFRICVAGRVAGHVWIRLTIWPLPFFYHSLEIMRQRGKEYYLHPQIAVILLNHSTWYYIAFVWPIGKPQQ